MVNEKVVRFFINSPSNHEADVPSQNFGFKKSVFPRTLAYSCLLTEPSAIFSGVDKRFYHLSVLEVATKLVQFVEPKLITSKV